MPELILKNFTVVFTQLLTTPKFWLNLLFAACPTIPPKLQIKTYSLIGPMPGEEAEARNSQRPILHTHISRLGLYNDKIQSDVFINTCRTSPTNQIKSTRRRNPKTKPMPLAQLFSCGLNVFTSLRSVLACLCVSIRTVMSSSDNSLVCTQVKWVTVEKCAELVGLTKDAIDALRTKGKLRQNFHWKKWEGRVYINLQAYQDSIEQEFKA